MLREQSFRQGHREERPPMKTTGRAGVQYQKLIECHRRGQKHQHDQKQDG